MVSIKDSASTSGKRAAGNREAVMPSQSRSDGNGLFADRRQLAYYNNIVAVSGLMAVAPESSTRP